MCAQRRLRSAWASVQSDQSLPSAWRKLMALATHWARSEDSDQTKRMSRLIWVFEGRTITKTCLYNFDPLKPHFYIVKLGFTGVYIIFLILLKNIDCGYSLEPPPRGGSNEYPQSMFWAEIWKILEVFIWKFSFFWWWNFQYIWIGVFS